MKEGPCGYCRGVRLVGWSGAGPILCPRCCEHNEDVFAVVTQAWREQRTRVVEFEAELATLRKSNTALQATIAAARVAVGNLPPYPHTQLRCSPSEGCHCTSDASNTARIEARRALELEPMPAPPEPQAVPAETGRECPNCDNDEVFSDGDDQSEGTQHRCEQCGKLAVIFVTAGRYTLVDAPEPQAVPSQGGEVENG